MKLGDGWTFNYTSHYNLEYSATTIIQKIKNKTKYLSEDVRKFHSRLKLNMFRSAIIVL